MYLFSYNNHKEVMVEKKSKREVYTSFKSNNENKSDNISENKTEKIKLIKRKRKKFCLGSL